MTVSVNACPKSTFYARARRSVYGNRLRQDGFTLLEMIVVLAIIALMAGLIVPNIIGRPDEARVTVARADLRSISNALELYRLDNQVYPTTEQGLGALVNKPTLSPVPPNWHGEGYLSQLPVDPWGNAYVYRQPGQHGRYDLMSYGSDGKPGGDGTASDLTNWTN